jgi:hypothetical protein
LITESCKDKAKDKNVKFESSSAYLSSTFHADHAERIVLQNRSSSLTAAPARAGMSNNALAVAKKIKIVKLSLAIFEKKFRDRA